MAAGNGLHPQPSRMVPVDDTSAHPLHVDRLLEFRPCLSEGRTARSAECFREHDHDNPGSVGVTASVATRSCVRRALYDGSLVLSSYLLFFASGDLLFSS